MPSPSMLSQALPAPPIRPMLAKIAETLPSDSGFLFEPKWDGFRTIVFNTAEHTLLQSRDLKPLNRYFPELEKALREILQQGCVLDGGIVLHTRRLRTCAYGGMLAVRRLHRAHADSASLATVPLLT